LRGVAVSKSRGELRVVSFHSGKEWHGKPVSGEEDRDETRGAAVKQKEA